MTRRRCLPCHLKRPAQVRATPPGRDNCHRTGCPVTANFPFCQLAVLDLRRLPSIFPQAAADRLLTDTFTQLESLPKRSAKLASGQTSLSRLVPLRSAKRSNRTLCRPKIDKTDSSLQVSGMRCGIFDVTGHRSYWASSLSSVRGSAPATSSERTAARLYR